MLEDKATERSPRIWRSARLGCCCCNRLLRIHIHTTGWVCCYCCMGYSKAARAEVCLRGMQERPETQVQSLGSGRSLGGGNGNSLQWDRSFMPSISTLLANSVNSFGYCRLNCCVNFGHTVHLKDSIYFSTPTWCIFHILITHYSLSQWAALSSK